MREKILIVGASARAAAQSARRAGFEPVAIDLFGDVDLARMAETHVVNLANYPNEIAAVAAKLPRMPWMYVGGLENHPRLVAKIAKTRPLWGVAAESLRRVRDPFEVAEVLQRADLPCPEVSKDAPADGAWLAKPRRSAGGLGIHFANELRALGSGQRHVYFQRYIPGIACSAAFVANADGNVNPLGVTRQLVGETWLNVGPFQYCGSVGPLPVPENTTAILSRLGQVLASVFQLRGLFGVDFILQDGIPWTVEINPRYTASMEVLEAATGQGSIDQHVAACRGDARQLGRLSYGVVGKAILFAARDGCFSKHGPWDRSPDYADIPRAEAPLIAGQPILSIFARGRTVEECFASLQNRVEECKTWVYV